MNGLRPFALAVAVVNVLGGCSTTRIAEGPLTLGSSPIEIALRPPLRSWEHSNKSLVANLQVSATDDLPIARGRLLGKYQSDRAVYFLDGRRITVHATMFLEGGESIAIDGSTGGCFEMKEHCSVWFEIPVYRPRLVIQKIRMTASDRIVVRDIEWLEGIPK
jgi:hypothetical protein